MISACPCRRIGARSSKNSPAELEVFQLASLDIQCASEERGHSRNERGMKRDAVDTRGIGALRRKFLPQFHGAGCPIDVVTNARNKLVLRRRRQEIADAVGAEGPGQDLVLGGI